MTKKDVWLNVAFTNNVVFTFGHLVLDEVCWTKVGLQWEIPLSFDDLVKTIEVVKPCTLKMIKLFWMDNVRAAPYVMPVAWWTTFMLCA